MWPAPEEQYPRLSFGLHLNAYTRVCTPPHIFVYTHVYTHVNTVSETIKNHKDENILLHNSSFKENSPLISVYTMEQVYTHTHTQSVCSPMGKPILQGGMAIFPWEWCVPVPKPRMTSLLLRDKEAGHQGGLRRRQWTFQRTGPCAWPLSQVAL